MFTSTLKPEMPGFTLIFQPDIVVLEIRDDGQGFNPPADPIHFARMGHYGLLGLYERSELIGAKLSIRSVSRRRAHVSSSGWQVIQPKVSIKSQNIG